MKKNRYLLLKEGTKIKTSVELTESELYEIYRSLVNETEIQKKLRKVLNNE